MALRGPGREREARLPDCARRALGAPGRERQRPRCRRGRREWSPSRVRVVPPAGRRLRVPSHSHPNRQRRTRPCGRHCPPARVEGSFSGSLLCLSLQEKHGSPLLNHVKGAAGAERLPFCCAAATSGCRCVCGAHGCPVPVPLGCPTGRCCPPPDLRFSPQTRRSRRDGDLVFPQIQCG